MTHLKPLHTAAEINALLAREFPQIGEPGEIFEVVDVAPGSATLRFYPSHAHLRPGGTISGPSLFAAADVACYCAILAHVGPVVAAVTANLSISFLNKPDPVPVDAVARILKLGRKLAFLEVSIQRTDTEEIVAHATATFSIPTNR